MATFSYTYTTLKADIQAWAEDDGTELSAELDNILGRAELRIYREADLNVFRKYATATLATSTRYMAKPTDFVIDRFMYAASASTNTPLKYKDISFIMDYWPTTTSTGTPKYYGEWDDNTFVIAPTADASYTLTLGYTYRPARIDGTTTTTWLSLNAPDLLLSSCMIEANIFLKNKEQTSIWTDAYGEALQMVKNEEERRQRRPEARATENGDKQ